MYPGHCHSVAKICLSLFISCMRSLFKTSNEDIWSLMEKFTQINNLASEIIEIIRTWKVAFLLKLKCFEFFSYDSLQHFCTGKWLKMVIKEGTFEAKKSIRRRDWLGFCAPLVVNCILKCWTAGETYGISRALQLKMSSWFVLFSVLYFVSALLSVHFFSFVCL